MTFSLLLVAFAAFITPMILSHFKWSLLPTSVAEIIVGMFLGKSCLNLVHLNSTLKDISTLGVILLMFLSGLEIDFSIFQKNSAQPTPLAQLRAKDEPAISPVKVATFAYLFTVITAVILALAFKFTGLFSNFVLAAILFSTTALGIVISVLKENELLSKNYGQTVLLFAVFGEVVPMLALTAYAAIFVGKATKLWLIILLFIVALLLFKYFRSFFTKFIHISKSTTQLDIRLAFFVIITLVITAESVGAENILGAFLAGIVLKLINPTNESMHKLDALGYGFFIPFYFILTGVKLNLLELLSSPKTLILIPLFFLAYLVAKLPAYYGFRLRFKKANSLAGAWLSGTTITLILAALTVAQELKAINAQQSGAFIIAAILTCILCPMLFSKLYSPEPEDLKKRMVSIIGANLATVTAAKHIAQDWYEVRVFTASMKNYTTYNSEVDLHYIKNMTAESLIEADAFNTDILFLACHDSDRNYELALAGKKYGIERVIMRFEDRNPLTTRIEKLKAAGVEYYSAFILNVGVMEAMIETPSTLQVLTRSDARLYEIIVSNARFAGVQIKDLPLIDDITISRIFRNGKPISPHGNTEIELNDHILFSGKGDMIPKLRALLSKHNESH